MATKLFDLFNLSIFNLHYEWKYNSRIRNGIFRQKIVSLFSVCESKCKIVEKYRMYVRVRVNRTPSQKDIYARMQNQTATR